MGERVVITGLGVVSPIGIGIDAFWESLIAGVSGIGTIEKFDTSEYKVHIGGEVKNFRPVYDADEPGGNLWGEQAQFIMSSTKMALTDAGISLSDFDPSRIGVVIGNLYGEPRLVEHHIAQALDHGIESIDSKHFFSYPYTSISQVISSFFKITGPSETIYCTCSSGNTALARAYDLVQMGIVDFVITGGVEGMSRVFSNFHDLRLLAPETCQPFDINRKGLVVAEGAGVLLVQSLESALLQKQRIYAEIMGYGLSCDAYHPSSPDPEGAGIYAAMEIALKDAGLNPEDIDYISAHGTGTKMNDKIETIAIKRLFFSHSKKLFVSSIKSMIGHSIGASSAIEAITCCLVLRDQIIPPTINYEKADPECDLNYVPNKAIRAPVEICMNNSLGFGGINASVILKKYHEGIIE